MIRAMAETEGVPQLVDGLLFKTEMEGLWVIHGGASLFQSMGRYDACFTTQLGFAIYMCENWDEEIFCTNCQHLDCMSRCQVGYLFYD